MPWVAIDPTDTTTPDKTKGGKWVALDGSKPPTPVSAGQIAKEAGQNIAVQGAGIAPIVAGAEGGALLGAAGGPFDLVTVPLGAMAGAGLGAMTSPTARYYAGKLVGSKQPAPTIAESNYEGKVGALTEMVGPLAGKVATGATNSIFDALVGKSELGQVGADAAQATEQANVTKQQKLQDAATAEATKQKTATATAAEKQGQTNLAQRADAAKVAADKQAEFQRAHEAAKVKADADFQASSGKLAEQIVSDAKAETIAGTLGKTPEQTRATRFDPNAPQRQAAQRNIIFEKSNAAGAEFNKEYEDVRGQFRDKPADLTNTAQKAQELETAAQANNWQLSPSTRKLLAESKGMARPEGSFDPRDFGFTPKDWAKKSPLEQQSYRKTAANLRPMPGASAAPVLQQVTIGQAIGLNSKWGAQMGGAESYDGLVAKQMRDSVLKDLDNANVPRLKELNNRYRAFRNGGLGDYDFLGKVSDPKGGELHIVMGEIVGNPQRGMDFVKRLSPEEKGQFRDMYADYINTGGKISPDHAPLLAGLGFKGPLTKPEAWVYADKQAKNLDEIFSTSPNARAKLQQQVRTAQMEAEDSFHTDVVKQAYKDANALGATGSRIKARLDAAKTLDDKANIAIDSFNNLDPGQAASDVAKGQQKPGMAGYQAAQQVPRDARTTAQGFQPEDPTAAATKAIQEYSPSHGKWSGYLLRRAAFGAIGGGTMGMTRGSIPPMLVGAGAAAGAVLGRDAISAAWRSSIQASPEAAAMFYRALQSPGTPAAMHTFAQSLVDATVAQQISQHGGSPTPIETKPAPKTAGPMVKHIGHEKAVGIAGPRGAVSPERVSRIEDLNKDIASGGAPEVNADLRQGRLTHTDLAKMVQPDKPGLGSLFQGMSPQQAVDAFAMADASERELALPALAQHLQETGKELKPEERQNMLTKLRTVLQPTPQQGAEG